MLITYAIFGLSDAMVAVTASGKRHRLHFAGGGNNRYGSIPATFKTADAEIQQAIQQSRQYLNKRIVSIHEEPDPQSVKPAKNLAKPQQKKSTEPKNLSEVKVSCIEDAAEMLTEMYGIDESVLMTWDDIDKVASAKGLKFVR